MSESTHAVVVSGFGGPEVLQWREVALPEPGPGLIRIAVRAAGVGPTDLVIRRGLLQGPFPLPSPGVLGFEAAGIVDALGPGVTGVRVGDEVAAYLPTLGGYAEQAVVSVWAPKPPSVSWGAAAALPASAEAAVGVLRAVKALPGQTLLVLGAGGSVGLLAVQIALADGVKVVASARPGDHARLEELGAIPVDADADLVTAVRAHVPGVDGAVDAAGAGTASLEAAVTLTGNPAQVVTLVTPERNDLGIQMSHPGPDRAPDALDIALPLLAENRLLLRDRREFPLESAAEAHAALEQGLRAKIVLVRS